jgi:hypothetical protein
MIEHKPHLLHVSIDWAAREGVSYRIECPFDDLGAQRPCAVWEECLDAPQEPESEEPAYSDWRDHTAPQYAPESDPAIVAAWEEYWEKHAEWEKTHPNGPWEPSDNCWVRQCVQESGYEDGWEFAKDLVHEITVGPVPVDYENRGSYDDSYLLLKLSEESDGE